jgi:hypothetical protein
MSIFRKKTPKGEAYKPNPETPEEYTGTVHVPSLTRHQRRALGHLPKTRLPGEK